MTHTGPGHILLQQRQEILPAPTTPLAAPPQRVPPMPRGLAPKRAQRPQVARHRVVVVISLHHPSEPTSLFHARLVHPPTQLGPNRLQLRRHPLPHRLALHQEPSALPDRAAPRHSAQTRSGASSPHSAPARTRPAVPPTALGTARRRRETRSPTRSRPRSAR